MQAQLQEILDNQKATWNKFSTGWKKWDDFNMNFLKPMGDIIIDELQIQKNDTVLDIASGTGEPALSIAGIATQGKVMATDLSEQMLDIAKQNALNKKLSNFETKVVDAGELPFAENSFDKISCRLGFMFFPDMQQAANEMFRVLKTNGRLAASVWYQPEKNLWITGIMQIVNKNMQIPPPPPTAPSMFRCASPGLVTSLFQQAGFKNIREKEVTGKVKFENFDHFWTMMNEVAPPVVGALSKADDNMKNKIKNEVVAFVEQRTHENIFELEYCALVVRGEK